MEQIIAFINEAPRLIWNAGVHTAKIMAACAFALLLCISVVLTFKFAVAFILDLLKEEI
jgi:hypothetical protein